MQMGVGWWVVPIYITNVTLVGPSHITYWPALGTYARLRTTAPYNVAGYGVIHIGWPWNGVNGCRGDVDVYTFNNYTGIYWGPQSPRAGNLAMNPWNPLVTLDVGPDFIAGTGDDGFGDGTPDPPGSSIVYLYFRLYVDLWIGGAWVPQPGYTPISLLMTTAVAHDFVNQPGSAINGLSLTLIGHPWEFTASNPALWNGTYKDPKANVWVKYASALSILMAPIGGLDILYGLWEYKIRADQAIPDIDMDQDVDIFDVRAGALAFGAMDEGYVEVTPGVWQFRQAADPTFDGRVDMDHNGLIDIFDLVIIAYKYGKTIDP